MKEGSISNNEILHFIKCENHIFEALKVFRMERKQRKKKKLKKSETKRKKDTCSRRRCCECDNQNLAKIQIRIYGILFF